MKTIEEKYQKKNLHEHILHSPDTYIGSIEEKVCLMWIYNRKAKENDSKIIFKEISYIPGFYKICDEVFVNAADHTKRSNSCKIIKININQENGLISVWNNGDGIDIIEHKEHKIMIPTMIFGELLTSTNYDKTEKKTVGGKNGFGAKLANIYSKEFIVETIDEKRNLKFHQKFTKNMYVKTEPKIISCNKKPYTKISFIPDFEKFGLDGITNDMFDLLKKRAYDLAMTTNVKVYFNDEIINDNNFTKYIDLYFPEGSDHKKVIDITNKRWKVCAVYDPSGELEHQNISFVNSICTSRGGTHVDQIINQVVSNLKEVVSKKVKGFQIKPNMIKENLIFFIDSIIENPDFDTQTKECMTTKSINFGSNFIVSEAFIKRIIKTGVVDMIVANAQAKLEATLSKTDGTNRGPVRFEKLYNAHKAGSKEGYKCTLILTEGDSAKTFAMSGLNIVGRDYYGVFPLRGKLLNVRDESAANISKNEEITAIKKIIGLEQGKIYTDIKGLRYGGIMILADQDVDGYHIKGLIMNFIHHFWPSLVKYEGFIKSFATPLLKASKGSGKNKQVIEFTNPNEYENWKEITDQKGWTIKYYKGLGTSTAAEAQECMTNLNDKIIKYFWENKKTQDEEENKYKPKDKDICKDAITLAFSKDRADDRKSWVNMYNPKEYIDNNQKRISYYDFIHKELITFSVDDNLRSIPNIMDGFKPSQRKVYYGSIEEGIDNEQIKVSELSGAISKRTKYHHGDQSLIETIINMAQNYVGSNNINLLQPIGQFGSRLVGGKDHASARYIFTKLDNICNKIFKAEDFDILEHQNEDNKKIEPIFYAPVIPMILVNGATGIGTGYSTNIPPCSPIDIYNNLKRIINNEKIKKMKPWYRNMLGSIEEIEDKKYISKAKYEIIDENTIKITDLPIGVWTDNYKIFLDNLITQGATQKKEIELKRKETEKKKGSKTKKFLSMKSKKSATAKVARNNPIASSIKTYTEDCTDIRINITIKFHPNKLTQLIKSEKLEKGLKLVSTINLTNMHLFDEEGKIRKYNTYGEILKNFSRVRLELYQKRKDYLIGKWKKEADILRWKVKFIEDVINGEIIIFKDGISKKKKEIMEKLIELGFPKFQINEEKESYNYITNTNLFSLSLEEVENLRAKLSNKEEEIGLLEAKTPSEIWEEELDEFIEAYNKWDEETNQEYNKLLNGKKRK